MPTRSSGMWNPTSKDSRSTGPVATKASTANSAGEVRAGPSVREMAIFVYRREGKEMFCTQCGNEVEPHARFCSKCGHEVSEAAASAAPAPPKKTEHDMNMHVNILGWLLVGSGILTAIGGMIVLFASQV